MTYFADHWHGRLPLWQAYWLNVILGPMVVGVILTALFTAAPSVVAALLTMGIVLSMTVWGLVGVWGSATAYIEEYSYPRALLGWLAYGAVCVGWLKVVVALISLNA